MKIKALITTLILGSSSVAMARPVFTASAEAEWRFGTERPVVVRDHRDHRDARDYRDYRDYRRDDDGDYNYGRVFPDNNALTADASVYKGPLPIAINRRTRFSQTPYGYDSGYRGSWLAITQPTKIERGRQFITDLPNLGRFDRVRLQNVAGESYISQVLVRFTDGSEQLVKLDARLNRWSSTIDIDLDGRARQVHGFVIYGSTANGSAYQLLMK